MKIDSYISEVETASCGVVKVRFLSFGAIEKIVKIMPDIENCQPRKVFLAAVPYLFETDDKNPIEATKLTEDDLEKIAAAYLAARPTIHDSEGNPVYAVTQKESESSVDCMGRVLIDEITRSNKHMKDIFDRSGIDKTFKEFNRLSDIVKESASIKAFTGLNSASESLRSAMADVERFTAMTSPAMKVFKEMEERDRLLKSAVSSIPEWAVQPQAITVAQPVMRNYEIPKMPPNPIHTTNEHLEDLKEDLETFTSELTEHITKSAVAMQDVARQIETSSGSSSKIAKWSLAIAILSLFVSCSKEIKDTFFKTETKLPVAAPAASAPVVNPLPATNTTKTAEPVKQGLKK